MITTLTPEVQETIINMYNAGNGATTISRTINRSECFVKYNLKKLGFQIRKTSDGLYRKYTLNEKYFDDIDSQEKAYWLGFLFADGYNNERRAEVKLCLNKDDSNHIELFKKAIGSNQPLKENACNKRDNTVQIVICNKHFSAQLAELGCFQDKSLHLRFPNIDKKYEQSFMLGYFDGDGCICVSNPSHPEFSVTSSYDFATSYQQILIENCELSKTKLYDRWNDGRALRNHSWTLRYGGNGNIKNIYPFLYNKTTSTVPCLKRKKEKFDKIVNARPSEDKLLL